MKKPLFEAKGISKEFSLPHEQVAHVLKDIDLSLYPDEIVAIIGPSGCGKSTLMRIIAGLIPASSGKIFYHGKPLHGLMPDMTMIFQSFALYPWLTVKENVEIVLKAEHSTVEEMEKKTSEAIKMIGLEGFEDAYPREISGGMKQRVGIARAIVKNPEILFMDEPFSSIDNFTAETLREEMVRIWADKNLRLSSMLLVSHDVSEVAYMADRIIVLSINPAEVHAIIQNKLPRPRNYRSKEFLKLVSKLHDIYGRLEAPKKVKKKGEIHLPFRSVHRDQIVGLLEYVHRRGKSYDIFTIGNETKQHFDHLSKVLDAAKLLGLMEMKYHTVSLTKVGKEYLKAASQKKKEIWREQVLQIPIVASVVEELKKAPHHTLGQAEIVKILAKEFPHHDAHEQFKLLLSFCHYGDLFTYHKTNKHLTLKKYDTSR
ncbi:MAG TPA: nitrate/sulfonate/bicarbonate ABC transporter ATP-binding protein [Chlamydiales bacterium]|nr:nitrate/sulfonate/bicarbonate ABC transporter ATP-binding protein [Chlamydiales bacterium]